MEKLKRIAAIHDISGFGKCSLTVALPVISASGVECSCMPTALLSTHTGGFKGFTFKDLSDEMLPIARHWKSCDVQFDGIYSGYLANAEQAMLLEAVSDIIRTKDTKIIIDPVMADNGEYYRSFDNSMRDAFIKLCAKADIITPNITEAALMTGMPYKPGPHDESYISELLERLSELCGGIIALTGLCPNSESIGAVAYSPQTGEKVIALRPVRAGAFHGTGDIFASAFSALMVRGAGLKSSTEAAIALVSESIDRTVARGTPRRNGVDFEGALPRYVLEVSKLFEKQ